MAEILGMPAWLAGTLFVGAGLLIWFAVGFLALRRAYKRLADKRPSPDRETFLEMLGRDVDRDVAEWVWETAVSYYRAPVAPHPDDHLVDDAKIDGDDIDMDWIPRFIAEMGMEPGLWPKAWPGWPQGWDLTVRNFARHLQHGRELLG